MNIFIHGIRGFCTNDSYYGDTDTLKIDNRQWDKLDTAGLIGNGLLQGKKDYRDSGAFYELFLAPKIKFCSTIYKYGNIDEYKTLKGFTKFSGNIELKEFF